MTRLAMSVMPLNRLRIRMMLSALLVGGALIAGLSAQALAGGGCMAGHETTAQTEAPSTTVAQTPAPETDARAATNSTGAEEAARTAKADTLGDSVQQ